MDIQRTGLIAILGILTYVLFVSGTITQIQPTKSLKLPPLFNPALQKAISPTKPPERELIQAPAAPLKPTVVGDHILISTPITDITIAPLTGGDIVQVLLQGLSYFSEKPG